MANGTKTKGAELSQAQSALLGALVEAIATTGYVPSYGELGATLGRARQGVALMMRVLARKGYVRIVPSIARGIVVLKKEEDGMPMIASDLGKRWTMWVDAAGCVRIAEKGTAVRGSLPVFSTETNGQADALRVRHCRLARDGSGLYFLNNPPDSVKGLGDVSEMFRSTVVSEIVPG